MQTGKDTTDNILEALTGNGSNRVIPIQRDDIQSDDICIGEFVYTKQGRAVVVGIKRYTYNTTVYYICLCDVPVYTLHISKIYRESIHREPIHV